MQEFVIDFLYNGAPYTGLVTPKEDKGLLYYAVQLESENQETHLDILANPCESDKTDWCFKSPDGQEPPKSFDKAFLQEIGEAIEKSENAG
jgi:hypothetical protein